MEEAVGKGHGIGAVREQIEGAFRNLHGDARDRSQIRADLELREALTHAPQEKLTMGPQTELSERNREKRVEAYISSALRNPNNISRRNNRAWVIEPPKESADTLIAQALQSLEQAGD